MSGVTAKLTRLRTIGLAVGIPGLALCCVGYVFNRGPFFVSYLFAFLFWTSLSLGCFYCGMIHYLTAGKWGFSARRFLEAGYMTLPLMALLIIPLFFGLHDLYPWARPEAISADKILRQRSQYENPTLFIIRAVVFFGIWICLAWSLRRWSLRQDTTTNPLPTIRMRTLSGPAIGIAPLTVSFAFVDWAMSLEPDWMSTVYPVIELAGQMLIAIAFVIVVLAWTRNDPPFVGFAQKAFQDLGSLLLAFVLFWTYVAFSQALLIYSANLPHEISWYLRRIANNWIWIVGLIGLVHFFGPFLLLLFRALKENTRALAVIALLIFAVHAVETFWTIAPTFYSSIEIHWTDFAAWFGVGGIWLSVFAGNLARHPLLARNDPRTEQLIAETAHAK
ncbi:MAG TPA: hypothetical protein VH280_18645 [Verrucomicrobiae bacterium]|jgi:hypothetical protein|nr:hypothetical protein [Verrucomicrobiae bacterium]